MKGLTTVCLSVLSFVAYPQQTFRVGVEGVRVDVLATDGGRPVAGLTASDFELRDSGVPQRIESVAVEDVPLRLLLALDVSGSVRNAPLKDLERAVSAVLDLLDPLDTVALLTFSAEVDLLCDWTGDRKPVEEAMAQVKAGGATALHDATYLSLTLRNREPGRALVLVFSDGEDTASWLSGQAVLESATRTEAVLYAVEARANRAQRRLGFRVDFHSGLQPEVPNVAPPTLMESFLETLARETGGKVIDAGRTDRVRDAFVSIVKEFRSRYVLTYVPAGVAAAGWHPIEVRLKGRKGRVIARRGYSR